MPIDQCSYVCASDDAQMLSAERSRVNSRVPASIIITNYNYARYVADAIESALAQTQNGTEVIVVDDGSTDNSREVLSRYAGRLSIVFQENKGQAAAFNTGFARAHGKIVFFLDADDVLEKTTVAEVVATFHREPNLSKVQWRLQLMDATGEKLPVFTPPTGVMMQNGNLLPQLFRFPDDIPFPPTSGNAYPARVLEKILPMPEDEFRLCADYYLLRLAPLYGPIASLPNSGGGYRVHGANGHHSAGLDLNYVRRIIEGTQSTQICVQQAAHTLGYDDGLESPIEDVSVTFLAHRLVSYKLEGEKHPLARDSLFRLVLQGIRSSLERPKLAFSRRILWVLWFPLVAFAPNGLSRHLAGIFYGTANLT